MKQLYGKTKAGIILVTLLLMSTLVSATGQQVDDELSNAIEENSISSQAVQMDVLKVGGTWDEDDYPTALPPHRSGWTFVIRRFSTDILSHIPIYCKGCRLELMRRCDGGAHWANFTGQLNIQWYKNADWEEIPINVSRAWNNITKWKGFDFDTLLTWYPDEDFYFANVTGITYYDIGDPQELVVKPMYGRRYYLDDSVKSPIEQQESSEPYQEDEF